MSSAQITLIDTDDGKGCDVELRVSEQNPESTAVIMATYLAENWDVVAEACRRHLVIRQAALDKVGNTDALRLVESAPKILNADGSGTISSEG